jgi:hypothetical protein
VADPALTQALEFDDGKLMLGKLETLKDINWRRLVEKVGLAGLEEIWRTRDLVALTNWTMLPGQTEIWDGLLSAMEGVTAPAGAILFVDLADPEKRTKADLAEAVRKLSGFRRSRRVVLGCNKKESMEIASALNLDLDPDAIEANARTLRHALDLDLVVIHPTEGAACAAPDGSARVDGPFCKKPKLTTGAGDNFNAGFCLGLMAGLDLEGALTAGVGNSGFYVRNARSASQAELADFLETWAGRLSDPDF